MGKILVCSAALALGVISAVGHADEPAKRGVKRVIRCTAPRVVYPADAMRDRIEGKAVVSMLVGTHGKVEQADIATSSGNDLLDAAAVEAVMGVRCTPFGEPTAGEITPVRAMQSISFSLDTPQRSDK